MVRWLLLRHSRLPGQALLWLLLTGVCGFFWHREEARLSYDLSHPLVVIAQETVFYRGNGTSYPAHAAVPVLHAGSEGRRLYQRGDWLQIELSSGQIGWVPADLALVDDR